MSSLATANGSRPVLGDVTDRANQLIEPPQKTAVPKKPAKTATKRKATEVPTVTDPNTIDLDGMYMDANCDQVRHKIRNFLDAGEMKKCELCNAFGVSNTSVNNFMNKHGEMEGFGSDCYRAAWAFFKKRELAGIKAPKKRKAAAAASEAIDLNGISLSGEASDSVPVYDSCDEVRKKINTYLTKSGITQAQFCRDLERQVHCEARKIQGKQLTDFRSKKGPGAGNTSIVFYTAYVYFEKLRLAEGKPKSKHRVGMEGVHIGGVDLVRPTNTRWIFCQKNQRPVQDAFGRIRMV